MYYIVLTFNTEEPQIHTMSLEQNEDFQQAIIIN